MRPDDDSVSLGVGLWSVASLSAPVRAVLPTRPFPGTLPQLQIRPRLSDVLTRMVETVLEWHERARQRRALAALDDHLLKDLGLGRAQAAEEWHKPFWRA